MRMVKTWYVRSLVLTERLILNSRCTQARKKNLREMLTSLLTLRDIHVCSTGLYKLSQKGLWSDTSPWCSLSERARTLIYNSLPVTRLTQHFFFAKRNADCQCCYFLKVSVNLAYSYVLISPPSAHGSQTLGFVIFSFRLVFRSQIFQSSWVQLIEKG